MALLINVLFCTGVGAAGGATPTTPRLPTPQISDAVLIGGPATLYRRPANSSPIMGLFPGSLSVQYPLRPDFRTGSPQVLNAEVYSVQSFKQLPSTASRRGDILRQVTTLQQINAGTLDPRTLTTVTGSRASGAAELPYMFNPFTWQWAAGAVQRLELPGGIRGIRYLVIRAGDSAFFPPEDTHYVFQGLTADGQFYVTVTAPYHPRKVQNVTQRVLRAVGMPGSETDWMDADAEALRQALDQEPSELLALVDNALRSLRLR